MKPYEVYDLADEHGFAVDVEGDGHLVIVTGVYEHWRGPDPEWSERLANDYEAKQTIAQSIEKPRLAKYVCGGWEDIIDSRFCGTEPWFTLHEMDEQDAMDAMACHACVGISMPLRDVVPELERYEADCHCRWCERDRNP
jgi:hypothetical protein